MISYDAVPLPRQSLNIMAIVVQTTALEASKFELIYVM